jgi:hypothetical protein
MGDEINGVIEAIGKGVIDIVDQLAPMGVDLTLIFITLGIVFLGATYMSGSTAFVSPVLRFLGISFGVLWALNNWTWLVGLSRQTAKDALRAVGIEGYGAMFELAWTSAQRIVNEMAGFTVTDPIASVGDSVIAAVCALVVLIGLSFPGLVAALAEVELLLGSALAPLVLPMLAIGFLRPIGFGVIQWQAAAVLRVIALGLISHLIAGAVTAVTTLPSMDEVYRADAVQELTLLSVLSVMIGLAAGSIANAIVRGTPGVMGTHSVLNIISGVGNAAIGAGRLAMRGGGDGAQSGSGSGKGKGSAQGGGSRNLGGMGQSGGQVGVRNTGSAFP